MKKALVLMIASSMLATSALAAGMADKPKPKEETTSEGARHGTDNAAHTREASIDNKVAGIAGISESTASAGLGRTLTLKNGSTVVVRDIARNLVVSYEKMDAKAKSSAHGQVTLTAIQVLPDLAARVSSLSIEDENGGNKRAIAVISVIESITEGKLTDEQAQKFNQLFLDLREIERNPEKNETAGHEVWRAIFEYANRDNAKANRIADAFFNCE